jgi:hypothetical protein
MFKKIFPFLIIGIGLWYLPESFAFVRNLAATIFQEAGNRTEYTIELKLSEQIPYLPEKFGALGAGVEGYRVELNSLDEDFVRSGKTDELGTVRIEGMRAGKYRVRVAKEVVFSDNEIAYIESAGESAIDESSLLSVFPSDVVIAKDQYISAVIRK